LSQLAKPPKNRPGSVIIFKFSHYGVTVQSFRQWQVYGDYWKTGS